MSSPVQPRSPWRVRVRAPRVPAGLVWAGAAAALTLAARLLIGRGYAGYDAAWSLVWGSDLAAGRMPSYEAAVAPTPHPLANVVAVPLSLFPDGGEGALVALTFVAFAALVLGVFRLGSTLLWWPAGLVAAIVIATRGIIVREAAFASVDIPFLALVIWAGAVEARRPARGTATLALLAVAGLLRPEAWLLSGAYLLWLMYRARSLHPPLRLAALALASPLLWALSDLLVTGDLLHSFTGTRDLAAQLDRPRGLGAALSAAPRSLEDILGTAVLCAGLLGAGALAWVAPRRVAEPVAAAAIGLLAFVLIGASGLPVLLRYLLVPAAALGLTAGMAPFTWRAMDDRPLAGRSRTFAVAAAVAAAALLVAAIPSTVTGVRDARAFTNARRAVQEDLRRVAQTRAFQEAARRCPRVRVPDFRSRPVLLLDVHVPPDRFAVGNLADGERGAVLTYESERAAFIFNLGLIGEVRRQAPPLAARRLARSPSWSAWAVC